MTIIYLGLTRGLRCWVVTFRLLSRDSNSSPTQLDTRRSAALQRSERERIISLSRVAPRFRYYLSYRAVRIVYLMIFVIVYTLNDCVCADLNTFINMTFMKFSLMIFRAYLTI